jgi:acetyl-CoA synthetase
MNAPTVQRSDGCASVREAFSWRIPAAFNLGEACADVQPPEDVAVIEFDLGGQHRRFTFGHLRDASDRFANALAGLGLTAGDRVAIPGPQTFNTVVAHIGVYKANLVAGPLSQFFGFDTLHHRKPIAVRAR